MHRFLLHNDDIKDTGQKDLSAGQVGLLNGWGVFSTLRIADGVLFAFERHWARMQRDARLMHVPFPEDAQLLKTRLFRLIEANAARNATLRVAVVRNRGGLFEAPNLDRDFDLIAFTTNLNHWGENARLTMKAHGRHAQCEFAGAKILSWSQNLTWYEQVHEQGFDEVVLLNERGEVSECTSANIFTITAKEVATPPLTSGCLAGITREVLLEQIHLPGVSLIEKKILPRDLEAADQIFITSSTRDLLPVSHVEGLKVNSSALGLVKDLARAFEAYRESYVSQTTASSFAKVSV
jgi:branched-chain amino acid aminotransferase